MEHANVITMATRIRVKGDQIGLAKERRRLGSRQDLRLTIGDTWLYVRLPHSFKTEMRFGHVDYYVKRNSMLITPTAAAGRDTVRLYSRRDNHWRWGYCTLTIQSEMWPFQLTDREEVVRCTAANCPFDIAEGRIIFQLPDNVKYNGAST